MKIQIASDLHLEGTPSHMPDDDAFRPMPDRDVLILAGDIGRRMMAQDLVQRELAISPVIYVPGNHEYYTEARRADVDAARRAVPRPALPHRERSDPRRRPVLGRALVFGSVGRDAARQPRRPALARRDVGHQ